MKSQVTLTSETPNHRSENLGSEAICKILQGELAAVEAYTRILDTSKKKDDYRRLGHFLSDHLEAVKFWREQLRMATEKNPVRSGLWGSFAKLVTSSSTLLGSGAVLNSLLLGEEYGLKVYQETMREQNDLPLRLKRVIKEKYIPLQERHIVNLDALRRLN